jgi:hypothetical protein
MDQEITTTEKPGSSEPIKSTSEQMKEFVSELEGKEEKPEESLEVEASNEDEPSEKKEEEEEDPEKDEKKKLNRYQRMKARAEEATKQLETVAKDKHEAIKIANIYRQRYLALEEKLKQFQERAKPAGIEESDVERENFSLKMREKERALSEEFEKSSKEEQAKQMLKARVDEMTQGYIDESFDIAAKYGYQGEQAKDVARKALKAYAFARQAGEDVTLKEVAETIMQVSKNRNIASQEKSQLEVNRKAPSPMRKGPGTIPNYGNDKDSMKAFLAAVGYKG